MSTRTLLLSLILSVTPASALTPADPWPTAPVLTRLFALPRGKADGQRLSQVLELRPAQLQELKRLADSEARYGDAGRHLFGRDEATRLNASIARFNVEKDRKVRLALGGQYPAFRQWIRAWWADQVAQVGPGH